MQKRTGTEAGAEGSRSPAPATLPWTRCSVQPVVPLYGPLRSTSSLLLFDTSQFAKAQPYVRGPSAFGLVHGLLLFSRQHCFPLVKFSVLIGQRKHLSPLFSCHLSFSPRVRTGHALLLRRLGEHHCTRAKSCLFRSTLDTHSVPFSPSEHKTIFFPPITCVSSIQTIQ
jgi:hypothetical protein